jgi:hypothetical protein
MERHEYIVVGAGPAGVQMGYFLEMAGRDYVILEAKDCAGAFFVDQPRRRMLISLNKKHNWFDEPDFNLRYDWNTLLTHDHSMPFGPYSDDLYPHADTIVKYLGDFAAKFQLKIQYHTRVASIVPLFDGAAGFHVTDHQGREYWCRCLLLGTGAVKPDIPEIEGIEYAEGYEDWTLDKERFNNKRVLIMGIGNSAFEIANHISGNAATVQIFTGGRLVKLAWQTHWGGDLRSVNNTMLDMVHLKMPHVVVGAGVTRIEKLPDGTLLVHYEEDFPHWAVPGTMYLSGVYDHVIRATGWKYVEPELFPNGAPAIDPHTKFAAVSPIGETSIPNLFFIGVGASNGDRKSTYGFISGFRYMVRTTFHMLEQRYQGVPYPSTEWSLTSEEQLDALVDAFITRISTNSSLYTMWSALADVLVIRDGKGRWLQDLPMSYVMQQPEMLGGSEFLTVTLEFGFDKFPEGQDALSFIHLNDPGADGLCAAFIHPVIRHFKDGALVDELHTHSGLFVRYDRKHEEFAPEFSGLAVRNKLFNAINAIVHVATGDRKPQILSSGAVEAPSFVPWTDGKKRSDRGLPKCKRTQDPDFVVDMSKYL